jgi:hypothetical protein
MPEIKKVLKTDDEIWKFACLDILVKKVPAECIQELKSDLIRLAKSPSEGEKIEGIDKLAKEILKK